MVPETANFVDLFQPGRNRPPRLRVSLHNLLVPRLVPCVLVLCLLAAGCSKREEQTRVLDRETAACETFLTHAQAYAQSHEGYSWPVIQVASAGLVRADAGAEDALVEHHGGHVLCHARVEQRKDGELAVRYQVLTLDTPAAADAFEIALRTEPPPWPLWYRAEQSFFGAASVGAEVTREDLARATGRRLMEAGKKAIRFAPGARSSRSHELSQ